MSAPQLTAEELEAAKRSGMSPERYGALKGVGNLDDFLALEEKRKKAEREAAA
jgi:hypothetical protein